MATFTKEQLTILKEKYDEAVYQYYQTGDSIMSDMEFDELKETLEANGYNLSGVEDVESDNIREKLTTENRMISLKKVQVFTERMGDNHVNGVLSWLQQYPLTEQMTKYSFVEVGWKLDGVASSLRYNARGELYDVVTRGNFSIKSKMLGVARKFHPTGTPNSEIRCEMIMRKSVFSEKYLESGYANPRNLVAGIVNDQNISDPRKFDICFVRCNNGLNPNSYVSENPFEQIECTNGRQLAYETTNIAALPDVYETFKAAREKFDFPTDGLVVYIPMVSEFEAIGKYPLNAIAIKFPPVEATTTVKEIQWNLKKSGEWIPKAILEPVDLDGSTIRRSLVFNYGYVKENSLYPGAKVVIAKNGDIIPYIQRVLEPGDESKMRYPENTTVSGIHMYPADNSEIVARERFIAGCYCLGIKNFGYAWFRGLATLCDNNIVNLFNMKIVNYASLQGLFGGHKKAREFADRLAEIVSLPIYRVLRMLQIPNLGSAGCTQVGRHLSGLTTNFTGLEKSVIKSAIFGTYRFTIDNAINALRDFGVKVEFMVEDTTDYGATYEMTGSPKSFGYSTKSDVEKLLSNWKHTKLEKTTTYLITDDPNSSSAKMKKAAKNGTKIITYAEAVELHNSAK